jgi:uncharacterized membrane protein
MLKAKPKVLDASNLHWASFLWDLLGSFAASAEWAREKHGPKLKRLSFAKIVGINFKKYLFIYLNYIPIPAGCHRLPERSFTYKKNLFPVCARCTGIAFGQICGIFLYLLISIFCIHCFSWEIIMIGALAFSAPMCIDWSVQYFFYVVSNNKRRFATGTLCGISAGLLYLHSLKEIFLFLNIF